MARRSAFASFALGGLVSLGMALFILFGAALGGCGTPPTATNGPKTAKEKQALEPKTEEPAMKPPTGKKWNGWRYQGDRNACFFVVGRRCFKTEKEACESANCGAKKCKSDGGGPATVTCAK